MKRTLEKAWAKSPEPGKCSDDREVALEPPCPLLNSEQASQINHHLVNSEQTSLSNYSSLSTDPRKPMSLSAPRSYTPTLGPGLEKTVLSSINKSSLRENPASSRSSVLSLGRP